MSTYPIYTISPALTAAFVAIVALVWAQNVAAVEASGRRLGLSPARVRRQSLGVALALGGWLALWLGVAHSGVLRRFDLVPPPMLGVFVVVLGVSVGVARSSLGRQLALGLPLWALFAMQAFRLPVELVLHGLYGEGALPVQMTFAGLNFDIVAGVSALVLAVVAWRRPVSHRVLLVWNLLGLALIVAITVLAAMSAPLPTRVFFDEPSNTVVTQPIWTWLPGLLVVTAYAGHLIVFRRVAAMAQLQVESQHFAQSQVGPSSP